MIPEKYMKIMAQFQKALKSEDPNEIDKIPLSELMLAKAHLIVDKDSPYYSLLLDKIKEKELKNTQQGDVNKLPLVFISYDTNDITLAYEIEKVLKRIFSDKITTFIAKRDIKAGDDAFKTMLHDNLSKCSVVLALCTNQSITSPWLWFESGAGFGNSKLIPIWAGVTPKEFKAPMTIFQGKNIADKTEMNELVLRIAEIIEIDKIDCALKDEEIFHLQKIIDSLKPYKEEDLQTLKVENKIEFPLPHPKRYKEELRVEERPINYIIEATFDTQDPMPGQELLELLETCKITIKGTERYFSFDIPDVSRNKLKQIKDIWVLNPQEQYAASNEAIQAALFVSQSPSLTITNWSRHFRWGNNEMDKFVNADEITLFGTRYLFFCKRVAQELKLNYMRMRIRLFDLQKGFLQKGFTLYGLKNYIAPDSNEVEIEQKITFNDEAKTIEEFLRLLMFVWGNFQAQTGGFPEFNKNKFLNFYAKEINNIE